ncbi:MAG: hypothetical protein LBC42_00475, partial [Puniceicoccales bacterium]|nr:hypothetical protein [Puniceicoccales bacterium]
MNRTAVILTTPMFGPDGLKHIRKDGASKFTIGLCVACVPPKIVAFLLSITLFLLVLILYIPGGLLAGLPVRLAEALQLASPETM